MRSFVGFFCDLNVRKIEYQNMAAATESKSRTLYVAVDIEKKGAGFEHDVLQLGIAYGTHIGDIKTIGFCFEEKGPFEKRCEQEFWSKNKELLERIRKEPKVTWGEFRVWLLGLELRKLKVEFVSDNPAYDIAAVDYCLFTQAASRLPMRYTTDGQYRNISDPSEQMKGLSRAVQQLIITEAGKLAPHTHWAPDDAKHILVSFFLVKEAIEDRNAAEEHKQHVKAAARELKEYLKENPDMRAGPGEETFGGVYKEMTRSFDDIPQSFKDKLTALRKREEDE